MYGDSSNKLILEAKRSQNLSEVPLYSADLIKEIINETNSLDKDVQFLEEQGNEDENDEDYKIRQCQLFVAHLSMRRNKRCLLAYERLRAHKIAEFAWLNIDLSDDAPRTSEIYTNYTTQLAINNLSHHEEEYYKNYRDLLMTYKSGFPDMDISGDLEPPRNIFIDVRVLKDGGEVQTEYGSFNLIKDSQFFVRKSDVERLIQQGYLEEL